MLNKKLMLFSLAIAIMASTISGVAVVSPASAVDASQTVSSGKLTESQKAICNQNLANIQTLFSTIYTRSEKYYTRFGDIQTKLDQYIKDNNITVSNSSSLQGKIDSSRLDIRNNLRSITQSSRDFTCDNDDPKASIGQYKLQVQKDVENMKKYRDALKEMLAATKTAAQQNR